MPFPPDGPHLPSACSMRSTLPLRGTTVMVVDDSRFTCDALRLICQQSGARLKRADTLAAARAHLACYRPDLAIVDLGLPDGPGTDLIPELAAEGLPVLAISGDPDGRARALDAGAIAFIDKPIPSVAGFVRLMRQLVTGVGAVPVGEEGAVPQADPMALRDDLAHAAALIKDGSFDPDYTAGFVRSVARAAGDAALERAALQAADTDGQAALLQLLTQRLMELPPVA